ncbi:cadherin-23-like isoform X2 [Tachypleus tridentatus]|uniref:cadherin-23-like isoform X2 n=1 Tax=Tachypleus tridentatus TaxID=6853 RepID=UPI003FD62855
MQRSVISHTLFLVFLDICCIVIDGHNNPPRFVSGEINEIIVRVQEGPDSKGKLLCRLRGEDPDEDQLIFGVMGHVGKEILRFESVGKTEANVYLRNELDREMKDSYSLVLTLTDGKLRKQYVTQTLLIIVEDINDNKPVFKPFNSTISVKEDTPTGLIGRIEAVDQDAGPFGQVLYSLQNTETDDVETFSVQTIGGKGVINLIGPLDFEKKSVYHLNVFATDRSNSGKRNTATAAILVKVEDIEDQPPLFTVAPPVTRIPEDMPLGSQVLTVKAIDGDREIGNKMKYRISKGEHSPFVIDQFSGVITVKNKLDREETENRNGAYVLEIEAQEDTIIVYPVPSVKTEVTIILTDVNDKTPTFRGTKYIAEVNENAQIHVPVNFIGNSVPEVFDHDQGNNGTFRMYLEDDNEIFEVTPPEGVNEASFLILVKNPIPLDYEKMKTMNFKIIARETSIISPKSSIVDITVYIRDTNDNFPQFLESIYHASVPEDVNEGTTVTFVKATDPDSGPFGTDGIRYTGLHGQIADKLNLDFISGAITIKMSNHGLDRETTSQHYVTVEARDNCGLGNRNTVQVEITLTDANDNSPHFLFPKYAARLNENDANFLRPLIVQDTNDIAPVFQAPFYKKAIPEDTPGGISILRVQAFDGDHSPNNNQVVYRIQAGAQDKFVIDSNSGIISVAIGANLDPDKTNPRNVFYILKVVALNDGIGGSQKQGLCTVNISITDVNNKVPTFIDSLISFIPEDASIGHLVTRVRAVDLDERPLLRYSIDYARSEARSEDGTLVMQSELDLKDTFDINNVDGEVTVVNALDREKAETIKLLLHVKDLAAVSDEQTATATLTVKLDDVNDNRPIFTESSYRHVVTENTKIGFPVFTVAATDADKNRTIFYSLEGSREVLSLISVDTKTGQIVVDGKIDRERFSWLNLTIRATDNGIPSLSGTADLQLQVLDENDNNPIFVDNVSHLVVPEDAPLGHQVAVVQATDADTGAYGKITYTWDSVGAKGMFRIDREKGEIVIGGELDRETEDRYSLIVEAWDNYEYGLFTGESRKTFKKIVIRITDVNDETPQFVHQLLSCARVTELHTIGQTVFMVSANDRDDPFTDNAKVQFSFVTGNQKGVFGIETLKDNTAKVFTKQSLRNKSGNYTLQIRAQDQGIHPRNSTENFHVCVTDVNDHSPEFVSPHSNYTVKIPENFTIGTTVFEVSATDDDIGNNGKVRYKLKKLTNQHWRAFQIDEITGIVTLRGLLDREKQRTYELRVEAHDLGEPIPLSSDIDVTVYVTSVNIYVPKFSQKVYQVVFTENVPPGKEKIKLPATVDEEDSSNKSVPCYHIIGGNKENRFTLNIFTHELSASEFLDREKESHYLLIVQATNDCSHVPSYLKHFDSQDNTLLQVNVTVKDINDNDPLFVKPIFTGGISIKADFGSVFMAVKAADLDIGVNSIVHYYIIGNIRRTLTEGLEYIKELPFLLDNTTGQITLNFNPQKGMKGYFNFEILVNDTGGLSDTAKVFIYLLREDQRVRFVLRLTPMELRQKLDEFRALLANITGAVVNVDECKFHENPDGSIEKKKSDLYLHFVNQRNNSIMDVDTVLSLIDKNSEFLDELFKEFKVLYTQAVKSGSLLNVTDARIKICLIGVVTVLAITLIVVISICITQRCRYERQLNATTTAAFDSQQSALRKSDVRSTNTHMGEGSESGSVQSNPLMLVPNSSLSGSTLRPVFKPKRSNPDFEVGSLLQMFNNTARPIPKNIVVTTLSHSCSRQESFSSNNYEEQI